MITGTILFAAIALTVLLVGCADKSLKDQIEAGERARATAARLDMAARKRSASSRTK